jgi:glucose-1-phosphate thymidylyltransferase
MKGIVLAGGSGTRLHPVTLAISKQLLPVYDKPMVFYPLSTLMLAGIRDILVITTPHDQPHFVRLLGDGSGWGLNLSYAIQDSPDGLAQAFVIARSFAAGERVALILGDNIFHGAGLTALLRNAVERDSGVTLFAYRVRDPERFGIVEFAGDGQVKSVEEKPAQPRSDWAITGLYLFDEQVCDLVVGLKKSARGEYEIADLIRRYIETGDAFVERLGRGITWFDTGTHEALLDAAVFIRLVEERQKQRIACLEEIAWQQGFLSEMAFREAIAGIAGHDLRRYLNELLES